MADEAASASNLCYFVAIHEVLLPSHSLASNSPSLATTMGPAPATPFTGLELGPLLGKARPRGMAACRPAHTRTSSSCVKRCMGHVLTALLRIMQGGYGRVYQALYGGSIVAAKVLSDPAREQRCSTLHLIWFCTSRLLQACCARHKLQTGISAWPADVVLVRRSSRTAAWCA